MKFKYQLAAALGIASLICAGCGKDEQRASAERRENSPGFSNWHTLVDGQKVYPSNPVDIPIEFDWSGHRWRIPAIDFSGPVTTKNGEVNGLYMQFYWDGKGLVSAHRYAKRVRESANKQNEAHLVELMPNVRYEKTQAKIESIHKGLGRPASVPGHRFVVYPFASNPSREAWWQAIELKDRMGYPIGFHCDFSMDEITSGKVFAHVPEYARCDGAFMIKPGFGVRYRFDAENLAQSEKLIGAAMTLIDSWIVKE